MSSRDIEMMQNSKSKLTGNFGLVWLLGPKMKLNRLVEVRLSAIRKIKRERSHEAKSAIKKILSMF